MIRRLQTLLVLDWNGLIRALQAAIGLCIRQRNTWGLTRFRLLWESTQIHLRKHLSFKPTHDPSARI